MKNAWKGLIVGALTGAAAGAALDRRAGTTPAGPAVHTVADEAASALSSLKQGVSTVGERLQESDAPRVVAEAADALRQKARHLPADSKVAADAVKAGAAKAAVLGSEVADKAKVLGSEVADKAKAGLPSS
jgi:hypothetical protein